MIEEAQRTALGASGLIMNPTLAGGAPQDACPELRGGFLNLDLSHTRGDMIRAVMEGIAFGMRHALDSLSAGGQNPEMITVVGGGSKSEFWQQIYANVMNVPLRKTNIDQNAASLGAAALAAVGTGLWPSFDPLDEILQERHRTVPDPVHVAEYERLYKRFLLARDLLIRYANETRSMD